MICGVLTGLILFLSMSSQTTLVRGQQTCFANQRFPKVVQSQVNAQEGYAEAITQHSGLQAIFVGGHIKQDLVPTFSSVNNWAHVGRIQIDTNIWMWSKIMTDNFDNSLQTITALSVDPQGFKIAVHGLKPTLDSTSSYLFVLDTATGAQVSQLMKIVYNTIALQTVKSPGMLLYDDGEIILLQEHAVLGVGINPKMRVASFDSVLGTMKYMKESNTFGHQASMVQLSYSYNSYLYIGGSFTASDADVDPTTLWHLAIMRFSSDSGPLTNAYINTLAYKHPDCASGGPGYTEKQSAAYISHMSHMEQDGVISTQQLFGLAQSNNYDSVGHGWNALVWLAQLGSDGNVQPDPSLFKVLQLESSEFGLKSRWLGMKNHLMTKDVNNNYYIHCIYLKHDDVNNERDTYYMQVTPGDVLIPASVYRMNPGSVNIGFEAVFAGSSEGNFIVINPGFQAYVAGHLIDYTTTPLLTQTFTQNSYAIWPSVQDTKSCVDYENVIDPLYATILPDTCTNFELNTVSLAVVTDATFSTDDKMFIYDLSYENQQTEIESECNAGDPLISVTSTGANDPILYNCYNYGATEFIAFSPNLITTPNDCTDTYWLYRTTPPADLPDNISVTLDSTGNQLRLGQKYGGSLGYQPTFDTGVYDVPVSGVLVSANPHEQLAFTLQISIDCCVAPTVVTAPTIGASSYIYNIGDVDLEVTLPSDWLGDNSCCSIPPGVPVVTPTAPVGTFTWDATSRTMTVQSTDSSPSGPSGETYLINISTEIRACSVSTTEVNFTVEIPVVIIDPVIDPVIDDPCSTAVLTIDVDNKVLKYPPEITMIQVASQAGKTIIIDEESLISSTIQDASICGEITKEFWDVTSGVEAALDPSVFSEAQTQTEKSLIIQASDISLAGLYYILLKVYYTDFPGVIDEREFLVKVENPCNIVFPPQDLQEQNYFIGTGISVFDVQKIAELQDGFYTTNSACGGIQFSAKLITNVAISPKLSPNISSDFPDVPYIISESTDIVRMNSFGVIEVQTNDNRLIGEHELYITAELTDHPSLIAQVTVPLKMNFKRCEVSLESWSIPDMTVPTSKSVAQTLEEPVFTYANILNCQYYWASYKVEFSMAQSTEENERKLETIDFSSFITFSESSRTITCSAKTLQQNFTIVTTVKATLSDGLTVISNTFLVTFLNELSDENQAPFFKKIVQEKYFIVLKPGENLVEDLKISLGVIIDEQVDEVYQTFICAYCEETGISFEYNDENNTILVPSSTPYGTYGIQIILSDDDKEDPKTTDYNFDIYVKTYTQTGEQNKPIDDALNPNEQALTFSLESLSQDGELKISFSQMLQIPKNLTRINSDVMNFAIIPHESSTITDRSVLALTWEVVSFKAKSMVIQVNFIDPISISTGTYRDSLTASIKDFQFFISTESQQRIPMDATDEIKAPKMMKDNQLMQTFVSITDGIGEFTKTTLISNFVTNLFLSGTMQALWGLIHCLQIVAHFPMINIMMPANAHHMFLVIMEIAQMNIVPLEEAMVKAETSLGIENDLYIHSDNFEDFGYESSDIIRNLQIMFLFILALMVLPLIFLIFRLIFRCQRCKKCLNWLSSMLFWNTYYRFILESYLEIALASILRFKNLSFDTKSTFFHSTFAMGFLVAITIFLISSFACLQKKNINRMSDKSLKKKYGELTLGLKTNSRMTLFYPTHFMLRRIAYSIILVFMLDRNYFQIQLIFLQTGMFAVYLGYWKPFEMRLQNRIELTNESLTMMCAYCLIPFSGIVEDAETRFTCGWPLIALVFFLLALNLTVIIYQGITHVIKIFKLRYQRRSNRKKGQALKLKRIKNQRRQNAISRNEKPEEHYCNIEGFGSVVHDSQVEIASQVKIGIDSTDKNHLQLKRKDSFFRPNSSNSIQRMHSRASRNGCLESISSEEVKIELAPKIKLLREMTTMSKPGITSRGTKIMPDYEGISDINLRSNLLQLMPSIQEDEIFYDQDNLDQNHRMNDSSRQIQLRPTSDLTALGDQSMNNKCNYFPSPRFNPSQNYKKNETIKAPHNAHMLRTMELTKKLMRAQTQEQPYHSYFKFANYNVTNQSNSSDHVE